MIRQSSNFKAANAALEKYTDPAEQECFADGYNNGHGLVCHNMPEMYSKVHLPDEINPVEVNPENYIDIVTQLALAAEEHSRCFSPWEQIANRINSLDDDSLHYWNIYDEGVYLAIEHDTEGLENGVQ